MPDRAWILLPLGALLAFNTACSDCGGDLAAGDAAATIDGADWASSGATWSWAGSTLQMTAPKSGGWMMSIFAELDVDGEPLEDLAAEGKFPIDVELTDGGHAMLYDDDGSYTSRAASGGSLTIDEIDGVVRACFDFEASAYEGAPVSASGAIHAQLQ